MAKKATKKDISAIELRAKAADAALRAEGACLNEFQTRLQALCEEYGYEPFADAVVRVKKKGVE